MVKTPKDLSELLDLLIAKGVVSYRCGDLELTIAPRFDLPKEEAMEPEDEKDRWKGLSIQDQIDLGVL